MTTIFDGNHSWFEIIAYVAIASFILCYLFELRGERMKLKEIIEEASLTFLAVSSIAFPIILAGMASILHFYGHAIFFTFIFIMNLHAWHLIDKKFKTKNETS